MYLLVWILFCVYKLNGVTSIATVLSFNINVFLFRSRPVQDYGMLVMSDVSVSSSDVAL